MSEKCQNRTPNAAEVLPGTHLVLMEIKDAQGRATTATSKLKVAPK